MSLRNKSYEIDMTHGSIFPKIVRFTIPLAMTSLLQLLYNAADVIVVGRFSGPEALAAVGSTGSLINLIINIFLGLSVGTNVIASRCFGAGDAQGAYETVHTSIAISLLGGTMLGIFGFLFSGAFLKWMSSPEDVLPLATTYMRIFFLGMPFNMLYNFGAAILRAVGDTKRPLYFLTISGVLNVLLNLLFVIVLEMGVAGVALATIAAQLASSVMVLICLMQTSGYTHLDIRKLHIYKSKLISMMKIGIPAGFQGACFSLSNVLIQSTVNGYGSVVVAGNSASQNLEGFMYVSMNAVHQASVSFVSANLGASENKRMHRVMLDSLTLVTLIGLGMGMVILLMKNVLLGIYTTQLPVIEAGARRLTVFCLTYFLCGIMDVLCGVMRGMGKSVVPMVVSIIGACLLRILWIIFILPLFKNGELRLQMLFYSYPISWLLTGGTHLICCLREFKHYPIKQVAEKEALA